MSTQTRPDSSCLQRMSVGTSFTFCFWTLDQSAVPRWQLKSEGRRHGATLCKRRCEIFEAEKKEAEKESLKRDEKSRPGPETE
ncbi:hypothetical protein L596_000090 [Steinernema carpocapsae]|nr:hypothetical protein L596_000090 [Steinernema carpocapsae]